MFAPPVPTIRRRLVSALAGAATLAAAGAPLAAPTSASAQTLTYETNFTKTDNVYNNLNKQFPNTGAGVANASFLFTPYTFSPGTDLAGNNGISFKLASDGMGRDFTEFGTAGFGLPGSVTVPIGLSGVSSLAFLVSAYNGSNINVTLTGADGTTQSFNNIGIPDFNGGGAVNSCAGGLASTMVPCEQTAFQVTDVGGGGTGNSSNGAYNTYDLVELNLGVSSALSGQTLTSVTLSDAGFEGLLLGVTAVSPAAGGVTTTPEPSTWALLGVGLGGLGAFARRRARV